MSAPTILVTVRGPLKTVDVELPGDVPVQELVPILLEMCGSLENTVLRQSQAALRLQRADNHTPLTPHLTLMDSEVFDGAILVLQTYNPSSTLAQNLAPRQFLPKSVTPDVETGGIGVTWDRL